LTVRPRSIGRAGIALFASGLFLVIAVFPVAVAAYVWPTEAHPTTEQTLVGHVDDYVPGSVTGLFDVGVRGYLVRFETGEFVAFDRREPAVGCTLVWRPREQVFRDPCHLFEYDIEGRPSPANPVRVPMNRLDVRVDADGAVRVLTPAVAR